MVMAAVSCLFDASCVVFLVFEFLEAHTALVTLKSFMIGYGILAAALIAPLTMLWSRCEHYLSLESTESAGGPGGAQQPGSTLSLSERPLSQQLKSFEFIVLLIFATVSLTRANLCV